MAQDSAIVDLDPAAHAYAPSAEHPFGRPHPDAPPELSQFEFTIGRYGMAQ